MREGTFQPVPAEASGLMGEGLIQFLREFAIQLKPAARKAEERWRRKLRQMGYNPTSLRALAGVAPSAVLDRLTTEPSLSGLFETVEYHGRRLAKLNLAPAEVLRLLTEQTALLEDAARRMAPPLAGSFPWVRDQLLFCILLVLNHAYHQVRAEEAQAFYELSRVELKSTSLAELLPGVLETLRRAFCAAEGAVFLFASEDARNREAASHAAAPLEIEAQCAKMIPTPAAHVVRRLSKACQLSSRRSDRALWLDPAWVGRYRTCWSVPMQRRGRLIGAIQIAFGKPYAWLPREEEFLCAAAERCREAIEKTALVEDLAERGRQLRQMAERMVEVEEAERRRISRELHDEAGQALLHIRLQLEMLESEMGQSGRSEWQSRIRDCRLEVEKTVLEIRRVISDLRPAVLDQLGLEAALRQLVSRMRRIHPMRVRMNLSGLSDLPKSFQVILYRLVQECCNNIVKHSKASNVNICLTSADGIVRLIVEDDGVGFDVQEVGCREGSHGLEGLRERVRLLGGACEILSLRRAPEGSRRRGQVGACGASRSSGKIGLGRPGTVIRIEAPVPTGSE